MIRKILAFILDLFEQDEAPYDYTTYDLYNRSYDWVEERWM